MALFDPQKRRSLRALHDPGVACRVYAAWALWVLGYPDQALTRIQEALARAHELAHPYTATYALYAATRLHQFRQEGQPVLSQAEAAIALATEHGFAEWIVMARVMRGWALAILGKGEEGIAQLDQGLVALRSMGNELERLNSLALLAEMYSRVGRPEEGLVLVAEALAAVNTAALHWLDAELYRLKGELTLQKFKVQSSRAKKRRKLKYVFTGPLRLPASSRRSR